MKTSAIFYRNLYESYNDLYRFSVALAVLFIVRTAKVSILSFCHGAIKAFSHQAL